MMKIEEITHTYLAGLNKLLNDLMDEGVFTVNEKKTLSERKQWFNDYTKERLINNQIVFIAIDNNVVIGSASAVRQKGKRGHIFEIGYQIMKEYRHKGIASALVKKIIEFLESINAEQIIAWVVETNLNSINLLNKFNFQKTGEIKKGVKNDNTYCNYLLFQKEI